MFTVTKNFESVIGHLLPPSSRNKKALGYQRYNKGAYIELPKIGFMHIPVGIWLDGKLAGGVFTDVALGTFFFWVNHVFHCTNASKLR